MHRRLVHHASSCLLAGLLVPLATTGCALIHPGGTHFTADTLPESLLAPAYDNPRTVQWTNIAMPAVDSQAIAAGDVLTVTIAAETTVRSGMKECSSCTVREDSPPAARRRSNSEFQGGTGRSEISIFETPGGSSVSRSCGK